MTANAAATSATILIAGTPLIFRTLSMAEPSQVDCGMSKEYPRILNGLMGLNGEAGEAIDILKKHFFQGHEFDQEHMAKELGDIAWYLAVSADAIGYDLETIFQMNVDKLKARYPDGFDSEHSQHRSANDI